MGWWTHDGFGLGCMAELVKIVRCAGGWMLSRDEVAGERRKVVKGSLHTKLGRSARTLLSLLTNSNSRTGVFT